MVPFIVYVQWCVRWLRVRFEFTSVQFKSYIKEIDKILVPLDCDFQFVFDEYIANFFFSSL